jgi:hypothetical protein
MKSIQGKLLICMYLQETWQYTKKVFITQELRSTIIYQQPLTLSRLTTYIYMTHRTANLQMLHFKYLFNKYPY